MSRTLRKQSGDRYWRDAHRSKRNYFRTNKYFAFHTETDRPKTWDEVEKEIQEDIIRHEKKDSYYIGTLKKSLKWHSNMMVRSSNRRELHRVLRDPENYDYNRDHDLRKKGLIWIYD